jgi:hypothetical protein
MKGWALSVITIIVFLTAACHHSKKVQKAVTRVDSVKTTTPENVTYIPFTRDLYNILRAKNIDVRKVQFFIDQQLILSRYYDINKADVVSGVIKFANGRYIDEIIIPALTPGVCDTVEADGLKINFERGNNDFKFINNKYSPDFFIFSGINWKDGSCDVYYNKMIFRATCGTCSSASDIKLVVRQSDIDNTKKNTKTLMGRKVEF